MAIPFQIQLSTRSILELRRSTRGSSQVEEGKVDPDGAALVGKELPGQDRKQSLVIEDYYCVSVEPTNAQVAPESLLTDALGAPRLDGATDDPVPGPNSSLLSEVEGPAQWLAAPRVGLSHGDSLSMESADDTSESEGKRIDSRQMFIPVLRNISLLLHWIHLMCLLVTTIHPTTECERTRGSGRVLDTR